MLDSLQKRSRNVMFKVSDRSQNRDDLNVYFKNISNISDLGDLIFF